MRNINILYINDADVNDAHFQSKEVNIYQNSSFLNLLRLLTQNKENGTISDVTFFNLDESLTKPITISVKMKDNDVINSINAMVDVIIEKDNRMKKKDVVDFTPHHYGYKMLFEDHCVEDDTYDSYMKNMFEILFVLNNEIQRITEKFIELNIKPNKKANIDLVVPYVKLHLGISTLTDLSDNEDVPERYSNSLLPYDVVMGDGFILNTQVLVTGDRDSIDIFNKGFKDFVIENIPSIRSFIFKKHYAERHGEVMIDNVEENKTIH